MLFRSVAIDTLSTITITPAIGNQVAGVAFNVAGTTNLPDGAEVEVFAGATSKGTATVASGAFTKSVTIADPATGVVMKVDDVLNSNAYDTEEIDIESGIIALQFGGSGDEVITFVEKIGTDYYVAGTTKSSTLFGESTGYSAGVRNFLAKLNSSGTKQWVIFGDADSNSGCTRHACYDSSGGKLYWISLIAFGASTNNHTVKKVSLAGSVEATYTFGYAYEYLIDITCDATNVYVCGYMDISGGSGARDCAWGKIPISTFNSITRERLNVGSPTTTAHATQIQVSGDYVYCAVYDYSNKKAFANKALISSTAQAYTNKFDATGARLSEIGRASCRERV